MSPVSSNAARVRRERAGMADTVTIDRPLTWQQIAAVAKGRRFTCRMMPGNALPGRAPLSMRSSKSVCVVMASIPVWVRFAM